MLIGQYDAKIDEKGRIAFPRKLRDELGKKLVVTFGYEHSLIVVAQDKWKTLLEGTEGKPFIQKETREVQRFLLGGASVIEIDKKGRVLLPSYLREFGYIGKEVIFLGMSRYVELWDKKRWIEYRGLLETSISAISDRLVTNAKEVKKNT